MWSTFLAESNAAVHQASVRISHVKDRPDGEHIKHKGKLKSTIIHAEQRMEDLSDMQLKAKKIELHDYHDDQSALEHIETLKKNLKCIRTRWVTR